MSHRFTVFTLLAGLCLVFAFVGCSDDPASSGGGGVVGDTTALELFDLGELVAAVAPPEFTVAARKAALDSFEIWTEGEYPLLDKVFGSDDPQTLYRNIDEFEELMSIVEEYLRVDENGDLLVGSFTAEVTDTTEEGVVTFNATATITQLSSATAIPSIAQGIIGTSVDLDYAIEIEVNVMPDGVMNFGLKVDSTEQTILVFESGMGGGTGDEGSLIYASFDPVDSTFVFKGIGVSDEEGEGGMFNYVFNITSESDGDFSYRMSWFSDDIPAPDYTLLGSIIGGGNKDDEFAMAYRQFTPADDETPDSEWAYEQVFGPNYTEGSGLLTDYAAYTDTTNFYNYDVVPQAVIPNPFVQ